jgi:hypothetical protein
MLSLVYQLRGESHKQCSSCDSSIAQKIQKWPKKYKVAKRKLEINISTNSSLDRSRFDCATRKWPKKNLVQWEHWLQALASY